MLQIDPQRSDSSQNDHKSKGYPSKTSEAAFTMQKADKGDFKAPCAAAFEIYFQKSDFPALIYKELSPLSLHGTYTINYITPDLHSV